MKTSPLEGAVAEVEAAAASARPVRVCVARAPSSDNAWREMVIEMAAVSGALESRWGEPLARGARPDWFRDAEGTTCWRRGEVRLFVALHVDGGELQVTMGCDLAQRQTAVP